MSYQGWGCSTWVTSWDFIKTIVPKEAGEFEKACGDMADAAYRINVDDFDFESDEGMAYVELVDAFSKATDGLDISMGYVDDDADSEQYGAVWFVGGVQEMTPAGKKYVKNLNYMRWVEYG
jgi:hypothetical protein